MDVYVILPAAGLGTRMAAAAEKLGKRPATSKQFAELAGVPILVHTLRRFVNNSRIREMLVAVRGSEIERFRAMLQSEGLADRVRVVEGGESRQESVANALAALKCNPDDLVLVHDAVRPFVDEDIINAVIEAAAHTGAAIAGVPAVDTVKQVERTSEGAIITSTVPRERVVMAQTPQGFRYDLLKQAFDDAAAAGFVGTDEASLAERMGHTVTVVMGSMRNIKITTPADMELAEFFLAQAASHSNVTG